VPDPTGRVPPHDLDAEAAVLSAMLLTPAALDVALEVLEPAHFYSTANETIFAAAREVALDASRDGSVAVDITTVAAKLRDQQKLQRVGGARYLAQIVDATPAVAHIEAHCKIVREKHRLRGAIRLGQLMAAEGYGDVGEPQQWLDGMEQALYEIARSKVRSPTVHISEALTESFTAMQKAAERGEAISGTATGFADLDNLIGGLHRGDLLILAARPGMGKSAGLLNMAANIASPLLDGQGGIAEPGAGVALFSLEMPKEQISLRMAFSEARVNLYGMRVPSTIRNQDWGSLTAASSFLARLPIWIDATPAINLLELRARVRRIQSEAARRDCWACAGSGQEPCPRPDCDNRECQRCGGTGVYPIELGMVGVDYLQLMRHVGEKGQSREQEVSALSRGLKALAKELDVPVVALSQLNRKVEDRGSKDKRPILADLRESGAIEQDADTIVFIYRDDYYNAESDERGIAELIVGKQRNGPTGVVKMRWTASYTRFDNLAHYEYEDERP
jgi:replicative DNA helicase